MTYRLGRFSRYHSQNRDRVLAQLQRDAHDVLQSLDYEEENQGSTASMSDDLNDDHRRTAKQLASMWHTGKETT